MKILFLVYHGFSDVSGISKKIFAQVKGLQQNGHEVHLCYYDRGSNGHWQRLVAVYPPSTSHYPPSTIHHQPSTIQDFGSGKLAGLRQRISYGAIYRYCVSQQIGMVYARCFMNANPFLVRFFGRLKKAGIKAVMEIPTYPYDQEFEGFSRTERLQLRLDQMFRCRLARQLEAIVTFTNQQQIFGQRTIRISNGVDLDAMPLHQKVDTTKELHLIGVAEVHYWHGYDRLIAGLGEYYKGGWWKVKGEGRIDNGQCSMVRSSLARLLPKGRKNVQCSMPEVYFHIVGGVWHSEMHDDEHAPGFHELIEKYGIQDKVIFHGQLFGDELNEVFARCSFAVGSLARHRSGISDIKTLKNREYASRGLPFVYSENDSDFDHQPYVLKVPADESPVDVARIVAFERQLTMTPQQIRQTVEHLSWREQMKKIFEISMFKGIIIAVLLFPFVCQAQELSADSIMATTERVAAYFIESNPDVGADSHVGGKTRNSRIWTRGVFYEGLLNAYRENPQEEWLRYTLDWGEYHQWYSCTDSQKRHADFQCCGQAYLQMYMMDPTQTQRMEHIKMRIDDMMATDKIDDWYWIDAIQMAMPIFAQLGTITGNEAYWERMYEMYQYTRNKHGGSKKGGGKPLFNTTTGLWYRDYQFDPPYRDLTEGDKDCYWSRGNGWVYMALARVMQFTPDDEAHRAAYVSDFRKMSSALLACQRDDGSWNVSLAAPSNYGQPGSEGPEMTGTSLFVGGMAYGVRTGLLDSDTYLPAIVSGWQAMRRAVHDDTGFVGYLQGSGSKPEDGGVITFNSIPDFEDFGIGCWLWGAAEVHALALQHSEETSGIHQSPITIHHSCVPSVASDQRSSAPSTFYTLSGQRVSHPVKGRLYISSQGRVVKY